MVVNIHGSQYILVVNIQIGAAILHNIELHLNCSLEAHARFIRSHENCTGFELTNRHANVYEYANREEAVGIQVAAGRLPVAMWRSWQ